MASNILSRFKSDHQSVRLSSNAKVACQKLLRTKPRAEREVIHRYNHGKLPANHLLKLRWRAMVICSDTAAGFTDWQPRSHVMDKRAVVRGILNWLAYPLHVLMRQAIRLENSFPKSRQKFLRPPGTASPQMDIFGTGFKSLRIVETFSQVFCWVSD